jgi:nucleotide-binding universal stress UspA family protein
MMKMVHGLVPAGSLRVPLSFLFLPPRVGARGLRPGSERVPLANMDCFRYNDELTLERGEDRMYKNILLPLDGSEISESAIPHVEALALGCEAKKVTIIHVVEQERYEGMLASGKRPGVYLQRTAKKLESKGINTNIKVLTGDPAEGIVCYAENNPIDIIVMASHGRSGVTRWAVGSVADKVFRASSVPVLMVKAPKPPAKKRPPKE